MMLAGRISTIVTALFMLMDGVMKIVTPAQVLEANAGLAYPVSALSGIGARDHSESGATAARLPWKML